MKERFILFLFALVGTTICWQLIDLFIVDLPLWKYLLIEALIIISKKVYEKEEKRLKSA